MEAPVKWIQGNKYTDLGKGKEWRLHKNLCYDWVSCKAVSKCIKVTKLLQLLEGKTCFFLRVTAIQLVFLLNITSHAIHANEQTVLVLLTLDEFITSIRGIVIISMLHWTSWTSCSCFLLWWPLRYHWVWSGLYFQKDNVSTLQRTKHLRVPLRAGNDTYWICLKATYR